MCVLMTVTHCFDQYIFLVSFKMVNYYSSNSVFHFQNCFGYAGSLRLPHEFLQWGFSFKQLFIIYPYSFIHSTNISWVLIMCQALCQVLGDTIVSESSHDPCLQGAKNLVGEADINQIITNE